MKTPTWISVAEREITAIEIYLKRIEEHLILLMLRPEFEYECDTITRLVGLHQDAVANCKLTLSSFRNKKPVGKRARKKGSSDDSK